jgi:hypothetical protein
MGDEQITKTIQAINNEIAHKQIQIKMLEPLSPSRMLQFEKQLNSLKVKLEKFKSMRQN